MSKMWMASNQSERGVGKRELGTACLLAASFLLFVSPSTFACSCAAFPADEAKAIAIAYSRADVIFLGVAIDVRAKWQLPLRVRDTTFVVEASWKGLGGDDGTIVRTAISETACGFKFRKRGRYLVFANWDPRKGILWTNLCELTREESNAQGLIKELDALIQQKRAKSQGGETKGVEPD